MAKRKFEDFSFQDCIEYKSEFLSSSESKDLYDRIIKEVDFVHKPIVVYGKEYKEPRLTYWASDDPSKIYVYSGAKNVPKPFTPALEEIRNLLKEETGTYFESVLVNYYRDGNDYISWHSDSEKMLDRSIIASVSLGATRRFLVRKKSKHDEKRNGC